MSTDWFTVFGGNWYYAQKAEHQAYSSRTLPAILDFYLTYYNPSCILVIMTQAPEGLAEGRSSPQQYSLKSLNHSHRKTLCMVNWNQIWQHVICHQTTTTRDGKKMLIFKKGSYLTVFLPLNRKRKLVLQVFKPSSCSTHWFWNAAKMELSNENV